MMFSNRGIVQNYSGLLATRFFLGNCLLVTTNGHELRRNIVSL
jgi:hypothetical protein